MDIQRVCVRFLILKHQPFYPTGLPHLVWCSDKQRNGSFCYMYADFIESHTVIASDYLLVSTVQALKTWTEALI